VLICIVIVVQGRGELLQIEAALRLVSGPLRVVRWRRGILGLFIPSCAREKSSGGRLRRECSDRTDAGAEAEKAHHQQEGGCRFYLGHGHGSQYSFHQGDDTGRDEARGRGLSRRHEQRGLHEPHGQGPRERRGRSLLGQQGRQQHGRQRQASTGQPGPEQFPSALQSTPEDAQPPPQFLGGLIARFPFEIAEQHRRLEALWQAADLFVKHRAQFAPGDVRRVGLGHVHCWPFVGTSSRQVPSQGSGGPKRDTVQPAAKGVLPADRGRSAREYQERSLTGILGIVDVAEDSLADPKDHRTVPPHERREGCLIVLADEALQQFPVGPRSGTVPHQFAEVPQYTIQLKVRHVPGSGNGRWSPLSYSVRKEGARHNIFGRR
jgi:hypothetical protein